jgi:hypothetical protein
MTDTRPCPGCGEAKPAEDFVADGTHYRCRECRRRDAVAYRAGMRKDACAVCARPIVGDGICQRCWEAIRELGGLDGLKRAARAVKYVQEK